MVAGGLFSAVAFAGAGYLFQKFNKDGYGEETKRHDLALEKLEKARQEWNQKDIERQEKMATLRRERSDADADFKNINKALKDYEKVTTLVFDGKKFTRRPHIWDFYEIKSLRCGVLPDEWKLANAVPVYKRGVKSYVENYRPISPYLQSPRALRFP